MMLALEVNMFSKISTNFGTRGIALFAAGLLLGACAIFQPARQSTAATATLSVQDPVKYRAAKLELRKAERYFSRRAYKQAMAATDQSLEIYETFEGYYLRGAIQYQQGQAQPAIKDLEKAELRKADDQQLLLTMGTVYTALGDLESAQQRYIRLHEQHPRDPVYAYKVGTTYKNLRKYPEAYAHLKKADIPGFRYLDQTYLQLGDVCLELKKYGESKEYFVRARKLNPKLKSAGDGSKASDMAQLLDLGNQAFQKKDYNAALAHYESARKANPGSSAPYLLSGSAYLAVANYTGAEAQIKQALKRDAANPRGYSLLGSAYHKQRKYNEALSAFDRGIQIAPENFEIHNKIGLVHRERGEYSKAIAAHHKALQIKPDYVSARTNLAFALLDDGRYVDARREFHTAARAAPDNAELQKGARLVDMYIQLDRGDRLYQSRNYRPAAAAYEKALQIGPDQPVVYNSKGRLAFARKRMAPAEAAFLKALSLDKNSVPALQGLLRVYARQRNRTRERATLLRLQKLTKNDLTAALTLGRIKEDEGKLREARAYYIKLLKTRPDAQALRHRLGYVYYKQGQKQNDRQNFKGALPLFEKAKQYNDQIPQLPETMQIVRENIKYARLLPQLRQAERLFGQARYREALPVLNRVYARLKRPLILTKIANCYIALGQEDKGIQLLENFKGEGADQVPIAEAIYSHLLNKGQSDRAQAGFKEIVKNHSTAYFSWYKLGVIDLKKRKYGSALQQFDQALIHKPDFLVGYVARGVALYEQGNKERARLEFEEALKRDTKSDLASFNLGVLFFNDGLVDRALKIFHELKKANPHNLDARYQLSYIYFQKEEMPAAEKELEACLKVRREPRFYHGLARIYEKKYQQSRNPADTRRLRDLYTTLVKEYPDTAYAEESRARLRTIMPDSRVVQPYPALHKNVSKPFYYNGTVIFTQKTQIVAMDSARKQKLWTLRLPTPALQILADQVLHVLLRQSIWLVDPHQGKVLDKIQLEKPAMALVGRYNQLGVVQAGRAPVLTVMDRRGRKLAATTPLARSRYFFAGKHFYQLLPTARQVALTRLDAELKVDKKIQLNFNRSRARPRVKVTPDGSRLVLYLPGSKLFVVDTNLELEGSMQLPSTAVEVYVGLDRKLAVPEASRLQLYDYSGKKAAVIRLPVPMASRMSLQLLKQSFLYVGSDRYVRRVDLQGKQLWKVAIPRRKRRGDEAYSIYY